MDEKQISVLHRYFFIFSIILFTIYIACILLSLFNPELPFADIGCLVFVAIAILIVQDDINNKIERIGTVKPWGIVSLPNFTLLLLVFYIILFLFHRIGQADRIRWLVIAQYDSILLDKTFRALQKLRQL